MNRKIKAMGVVLCILLITSFFSGAAGKMKETDIKVLATTASLWGVDGAISQDCPPCMVSYWKLDELSGIIVNDSYGGNDGGIQTDGDTNEPAWTTGKVGNGLYFAGDASDSVEIEDDPGLHFGTGDFALEAWIKYEGPTDGSVMYPAIMSKRPGPPGSNPLEGFGLYLTYWPANVPGTLLMRIEDRNYVPCSTPVDDGGWHHVVVQRCKNTVEFYIDGLLDGTAASNKDATTKAGLSLGLDASPSFDTAWEGLLDEVAVYKCCLSPDIINWHYKLGLTGEGYCLEEELCECGEWNKIHVSWTDQDPNTTDEWTGSCGDVVGTILSCKGNPITVDSSSTCNSSCGQPEPNYSWNVTGPHGYEDQGSGLPAEFIPPQEGTYEVILHATCDGEECISCNLTLGKVVLSECECSISVDKKVSSDGGQTWSEQVEQYVDQDVQFKVTVTNNGDLPLSHVTVADTISECLEYLQGSANYDPDDASSNYIVWSFPTQPLQPGDSIEIMYTAHVTCAGVLKNAVSAKGIYDNQAVYAQEVSTVVTGKENGSCACLYSSSDNMDMLTSGEWDLNNPGQGTWKPVNTIPENEADNSEWGKRFADLPWSFMYGNCAHWVYGHENLWTLPNSSEHEYYRLPFTTPNGTCVELHFKAYIDDAATFYIDGPGFTGPTPFYEHDPSVSMYGHDPVKFVVDVDDIPGADCLQPGTYTIYINHWDTIGAIYGLIFTAECVPCSCGVPESPSITVDKKVSSDGGQTWSEQVEQYVDQDVQFKVTVTNNGDLPLTNVTVEDTMSECLEYLQGSANYEPDDASSTYVVWSFPTQPLQPGDSTVIMYTVHVTCAGVLKNAVSAKGICDNQAVYAQEVSTVVTGKENGPCLGTVLLVGIIALGAIILQKRED
jgi:uncharacterized repeat protein (TIGR01451 family)